MDLRRLRYFIAVAEERHFRRAAERLHMSQPPLSQQIQALEEELGVPLLVRDRRSVRLTEAGDALLRRARALLELSANAATDARRIGRGEAGRLVIGFMSSAMLSRLTATLQELRVAHPDVAVELRQLPPKEQIEALASGRIDLGFSAIMPSRQDLAVGEVRLKVKAVWEEELVAAVPIDHRLAARSIIPLRALAAETFITLPRMPEAGHYDRVLRLCARSGFRVKIGQEVEQLPAALALIAAGYGVTLAPVCAIDAWRNLVAFPKLKERPAIPVTSVWRADNSSPVLTAFREILLTRNWPALFSAE